MPPRKDLHTSSHGPTTIVDICKHLLHNASRRTLYLQFVALLSALGAGAAIPCMIILWGDLADSFLRYAKHDLMYSATAFERDISITSLRMVYIFFAKFVLGYIYMVLFTITAADISFNLRVKYVQTVLERDVAASEHLDIQLRGDADQGVGEIEQLEVGLGEQLGLAIQLTSVVLSAFIISVAKQWKLGLAVSTMIPATVITIGVTVAIDVHLETQIRRLYEITSVMAKDALGNIRDILASTASNDVASRYDEILDKAKKTGIRKAPAIGIQHAAEVSFVTCGYALSFWYGTKLYSDNGVSLGSILTVFFCVALANSSLTGISVQVLELTRVFTVARKVLALIETQGNEIAAIRGQSNSAMINLQGCLVLRNVNFSYPARPDRPVYTNLTCTFPPGQMTAVVGASGAGKSTIVALLERWFDVSSGSIALDGVEIRQLDTRWLRKQIGLVQQEPTLFQDSIFANISRGLIGTPHEVKLKSEKMELVIEACRLANAADFITALPHGYETCIGPGGNTLSGGQKQRLAIARAIVSDPKILILDEATSALDAHSEGAVEAALEQAAVGRTTILITHKPSQAMKADNVFVMTPDGIEESGPPKALMKSGGLFSRFLAHGAITKTNTVGEIWRPSSNRGAGLTSEDKDPNQMSQQVKDEKHSSGVYSLSQGIRILLYNERHHWLIMVSLFFPCILGGLIFPAEAVLFGKVANVFLRPVAAVHAATNFWALMFFILALIILVVYGWIGHNAAVFCYVIGRDIRSGYFQSFLRQSITYFETPGHSPGVLTARLLQHPLEIEDFFCRNIPVILIIVVTILTSSILAIVKGWKLGLVTVFGALTPICIAGLVRLQLGYINEKKTHEIYYRSAGFVSEYAAAPRTVSSLCMESTLVSEYRTLLRGPLKQAKKHALYTMFFLALADSLQICGMALTFWYGGTLLASRSYELADFYTIFTSVVFAAQATTKLFGFTYSFTKGKFAANHILGVQNTQELHGPPEVVDEDMEKACAVSFRDVYFQYSTRNTPVFRGLTFDIMKGQKVAFVGSSGSGKSTILSLIERFYEPAAGKIFLAGRCIAELAAEEIRKDLALVPQEHFLYRGTIRDNLCFGLARSVTEEELQDACKAAAIYDFISSLPEGFGTQCGGSGGNIFSGGQRQRLIIARAFIRKPLVLLLDEVTSALDAENELLLTETLLTLPADITVIAIAHRFSTIRKFDTIFVLDEGRIAEVGSYEELLSQRGLFYKMVNVGQ